mmetsp:Transcript_30575/g.53723  ORF Transcript_30575/g.53723 Transcript_30575/m.53723 type:complete len:237 (+) Transcript_30575:198-908(+)|eukprot:CAMPEP_0204905958 /NCGR_PEP_ID=MMETSP1397-20131031/5717_1 /ASSEMBLY_ACC=CAM_ASM_000891 /TAXON_ID=49980 /ORGANISM="Climacostomum Climacostomum virens, Strain Stock W-24" /LENGTH=236 /DNA_ID=CAMNT_0052074913 /DNA_START=49 /DNA_END=759 /DNA_ORIENTATION=-
MASRALRLTLKAKLVGANRGYDLLKRKLEGLKKKFQEILKEIVQTKKTLGLSMGKAHESLIEAQWGAGDFAHIMIETVKRASLKISVAQTNVAGVFLPIFHEKREEGDEANMKQFGISGGGAAITHCRERFSDLIKILIQLSSLQTAFMTLDEVIKVTSRRVNALEHVLIPKIKDHIRYIDRELEELEREDFFRLKKVQANKKAHMEKERINKEQSAVVHSEPAVAFGERDSDLLF